MPTVAMPPAHVVIVVEENQNYSRIIGSPDAPFINTLAAQGTLFTNYHGVARPSQPNYFAMLSGSTHGVMDNKAHFFTAPTLAGQLTAAGYSFGGYAETGSPQKHNPWQSFADAKAFGRDFRRFPSDFSKLPTVSFVSPDLMDDMHDGTIRQGDRWLKDNLGAYAEWAKTHDSLLIVVFDEDGHGEDQRVATIVAGDGVTPLATGQAVNHYSLLHTLESLYGLPALDQAATAPVMEFGRTAPLARLPINPRMSGPTEAIKPKP